MFEINFEIVKKIGVLSRSAPALPAPMPQALVSLVKGSGWAKEFNQIRRNQ